MGMKLRYVARAARFAPPYVLAMLQSGAAATSRSAVLDDMECMYRVLAPKLDELGSSREMPTRWEDVTKQWPVQWRSMVTRFVEKRTEMERGEERGTFRVRVAASYCARSVETFILRSGN